MPDISEFEKTFSQEGAEKFAHREFAEASAETMKEAAGKLLVALLRQRGHTFYVSDAVTGRGAWYKEDGSPSLSTGIYPREWRESGLALLQQEEGA